MKKIMNIALTVALTLSFPVIANADKINVANGMEIASGVCAGCHSADGNSIIPINPSLAGQLATYITKQLKDFKAGEDGEPANRVSPVMGSMVAALSEQDMIDLGAYYAQQTVKPTMSGDQDKDELAAGEIIFRGGILENEVPACASCHLPNGAGLTPHYPQLAGQHADYTIAQLNAFSSGERANDKGVMKSVVTRMSSEEKSAVSAYISGLK